MNNPAQRFDISVGQLDPDDNALRRFFEGDEFDELFTSNSATEERSSRLFQQPTSIQQPAMSTWQGAFRAEALQQPTFYDPHPGMTQVGHSANVHQPAVQEHINRAGLVGQPVYPWRPILAQSQQAQDVQTFEPPRSQRHASPEGYVPGFELKRREKERKRVAARARREAKRETEEAKKKARSRRREIVPKAVTPQRGQHQRQPIAMRAGATKIPYALVPAPGGVRRLPRNRSSNNAQSAAW